MIKAGIVHDCGCPVQQTMRILEQKWVLRIIRELRAGTLRFCELQHRLAGMNAKTLSQRLKLLEDEGLVHRHLISALPLWVEYELSEKGRDLAGLIADIDGWAQRWMAEPAELAGSSR